VSWYTANPEADEFYIDDEAGLFGLWVLMSDAVGDYIADESEPMNFFSKTITLRSDLDLAGISRDWIPIGRYGEPGPFTSSGPFQYFQGTFDGGGHRVTYSGEENTNWRGGTLSLFYWVGNMGTVRNLAVDVTAPRFTSADVLSSASNNGSDYRYAVGGVAFENEGTISGCSVSADMGGEMLYVAGGVVTYNRGLIENCSVTGFFSFSYSNLHPNERNFGGIVGQNLGASSVLGSGPGTIRAVIRGCSFTGSVRAEGYHNNPQPYIGGIAGSNYSAAGANPRTGIIEGCRVEASLLGKQAVTVVAGAGTYVGGIAGISSHSTILRDCSFKGRLSGNYVGGIFGATRTGGDNTIPLETTGCVADFTLDEEGMASFSGLMVLVGGIVASPSQRINIENCYVSADLTIPAGDSSTGAVYVGGIVSYPYSVGLGRKTDIKNCVFKGEISTTRNSGVAEYIGGIAAYFPGNNNFDNYEMKNCVSLGSVKTPTGTNKYIGAIAGFCDAATVAAKITNCQWLADETTNAGLSALSPSITAPVGTGVTSVSSAAALPPTAAMLTPSYAVELRLGGRPIEFTVKVYPEESSSAGNIIGSWTASGSSAELAAVPGSSRASLSPVALGDTEVLFLVWNTGNPAASLFGGYAPSLSARVTVLPALDADAGVDEIWTEVGGERFTADGDGVILLPEETDSAALEALPIWITPVSPKAVVSPEADGGAYDFTETGSRVFTVTAEDGTTVSYTVFVRIEENVVIGDIVDSGVAAGDWEAEAFVRKSGVVEVTLWMPMSIDPALIGDIENITAEVSGFDRSSVTFTIVQGNKVIKDFTAGSTPTPTVQALTAGDEPYMLLFSGTCADEEAYESARIDKLLFWMEGSSDTHEQALGAGGAGVAVASTKVSVEYEEKKEEEEEETPGLSSSGGGCDAGSLALAALGIAALAAARGRRR
jgi:hypothetical protein